MHVAVSFKQKAAKIQYKYPTYLRVLYILSWKSCCWKQCFTTSFDSWNSGFKPLVSTSQPTAVKILDAHSLTIYILRWQQLSVHWTINNLEKLQKIKAI